MSVFVWSLLLSKCPACMAKLHILLRVEERGGNGVVDSRIGLHANVIPFAEATDLRVVTEV